MDAFATKEQMAARSQGTIPADHPFLDQALAAASTRIRNACRWHVAKLETTVFRRRYGQTEEVWLPSLHIQSIDSVTVDGSALNDLSAVEFDTETGWTNLLANTVSVTFSHGYDDVPEDILDLTLQIAARSLGSPLGYTREQAGSVSVSASLTAPGVAGGTVLLPHEETSLSAYTLGWTP